MAEDKNLSSSKPEEDDEEDQTSSRSEDLSRRKKIRDKLKKVFTSVENGFRDQWERANDQIDFWDVYNCKLNAKQFYNGNSKIYVPVIHNAVNARKTRFTNQIFPINGKYVECVSSDGVQPSAMSALLEHYVRKAELRTKIMPALMKAGDVEGQYNVYVQWCKRKRHVTWRKKEKPSIDGANIPNPAAEEVDTIEEDEIEAAHPEVEVIPDSDVLVLPQTSDSIPEALDCGGSVTILRRWTKDKVQQMIDEKAIRKDIGEDLIEQLEEGGKSKDPPEYVNQKKEQVDSAGIKGSGGSKHVLVYETYCMLKVHGERRLCRAFYAGKGENDRILSCHLNPLWSDRVPLLSVPVEKVAGAFKGRSMIAACVDLQYAANDAVNEAWDSAAYSLMPIVMTDPEKNPRTGSMILSQAAIWETNPNDTQIVQFPPLWEKGFEMVNHCKAEISQTLSVSPAAITQGVSSQLKSKQNQAQIAQEQQIDILTTADAVTVIEEGILSPLLVLFTEMDHQYRDEEITVRAFGDLGQRAAMEKVPPIQMDKRYQFKWLGVESARNAQQVQQQISFMNVLTQIPPQALRGRELDVGPILEQACENIFGPRIAPLVLIKPLDQLPVPVEEENMLLSEGFEVPTHKMDDDNAHIQGHMMAMKQMQMMGNNKNQKKFQSHIMLHVNQRNAKMMAQQQMAQGGPPQQQGQQGGGQQQGAPRPGAMNKPPRGNQGPPGMIPHDTMAKKDPMMFPRKMGFGGGGM